MINILYIGDIFGHPGRRMVREFLPSLINTHALNLVVANAENAAGGIGLTVKTADELFSAGVDILTSGNHIFKHKEIMDYLEVNERLLRPANYPDPAPGRGSVLLKTGNGVEVGILNLQGRTFMTPIDCPFKAADRELENLKAQGARIILVDFHAEATSEKVALGWYLDGRAGSVIGSHTHVQTADETILPQGTAYITDAGMTGPHQSVIGMKKEPIIDRFLTGRPTRFEPGKKGLRLEGVVCSFDPETGHAEKIQRIKEIMEKK